MIKISRSICYCFQKFNSCYNKFPIAVPKKHENVETYWNLHEILSH
ncbi:unnamed protein product, partial [Larinioides sclopetarius]